MSDSDSKITISQGNVIPPQEISLNGIAEDLIRLSFHLERHVPGLVDAYSGPASLRDAALQETPMSPGEIQAAAEEFLVKLDAAIVSERQRYLIKHFNAVLVLARLAQGANIPFAEEVRGLYDIEPKRIAEEELISSAESLALMLPGSGSIAERIDRFRAQLRIPAELIEPMFREALTLARDKTRRILPLPEGEDFTMQIVNGKPWSGYHWYLGNYLSRIEINVDVPRRVDELLHLMTHEGYPGHHTEAAIKDAELYFRRGRVECTLRLLFAPQSVLAEGIAEVAEEIVFTRNDRLDFLQSYALPTIGAQHIDGELILALGEEMRKLKGAFGNAAFLLFDDRVNPDEVASYLRDYALMEPQFAAKRVEFLQTYRGYSFVYSHGYNLVKDYLAGQDMLDRFKELVMSAKVPSQLLT